MAEHEEPGFVIGDRRYDFPSFDSFNLDEAEVFFEIAGFGIEELDADPDDHNANREIGRKLVRPRTIRALAAIAWMRGNDTTDMELASKSVGGANFLGSLVELFRDDEDPQEADSVNTQNESSLKRSADSSENSGTDSSSTSETPEDPQPPTGTSESDTSSPAAPETTSDS